MTEVWERQKGEPSKSFEWFKIYRNLRAARTLKAVITTLTKSDIIQEKNIPVPSETQLTTQSARWNWVERCRKYDNYMDQKERLQYEELFKKENVKYQDFFKEGFELLKEIQNELKTNDNGNAPTTRANSFLNLNKAADINYRNFRLSHGQPTDIKDNNTQIQGTIETTEKENPNVMNKSDKELEELLCVNDDFNMEEFLEQQETK